MNEVMTITEIEEVYRKGLEVKEPRHIAIFSTGPIPAEGTEILLPCLECTA